MKINRKDLLKILKTSSIGLTKHEVLEQSNAFVFEGGTLYTFNDEILARAKSPLDFDAVVPAQDFLKVLAKFPDDVIDVSRDGEEIVIKGIIKKGKGRKRQAGVSCFVDVQLPYSAVPAPKKWKDLENGSVATMMDAARTCGKDHSNPLTTVVHVTKDRMEGCDNFRLFRADLPTGFPSEVLIPASSILALEGLVLLEVSIGEGWVHFRSDSDHDISVRCSHGSYFDPDPLLKLKKPEKTTLPANLPNILSRAEVMTDQEEGNHLVKVILEEGSITLESRKIGGWYREKKNLKGYKGKSLTFDVHPKFFLDIINRTRTVEIGSGKMKIKKDNTLFVVCLEV